MAELTMAGVGQIQADGTDGINGYLKTPGSSQVEVFRVTSTNATGDFVFSRKFIKIKTVLVQNHGANIGTGVKDPPKLVVTQGNEASAAMAKVEIQHTATQEVFSLIIFGDL